MREIRNIAAFFASKLHQHEAMHARATMLTGSIVHLYRFVVQFCLQVELLGHLELVNLTVVVGQLVQVWLKGFVVLDNLGRQHSSDDVTAAVASRLY